APIIRPAMSQYFFPLNPNSPSSYDELCCEWRRAQRWMQALKCPFVTSSRGGTTVAHSGVAIGQRVRKTQPLGGSMGEGVSPLSIVLSRLASGSGTGAAERSACV